MAKSENAVPGPFVLAVGLGRGGGGKSTGLAEMAWRARAGGRDPIIADFDMRSGTLSALFPGEIVRPPTDELPDGKAALSRVLNQMVKERRSCILDLGAGDPLLKEYGRDLDLVGFCARRKIDPVAVYFLGPDEEDLNHCSSIWRSGAFRPDRALLVMNEGVIREGRTVAGAFEKTLADARLKEMVADGAVPILMRRLHCMDLVRKPGLGFYAALEGRGDLDAVEEFMCGQWRDALDTARANVGASHWLP
jgi:hypothetical protein